MYYSKTQLRVEYCFHIGKQISEELEKKIIYGIKDFSCVSTKFYPIEFVLVVYDFDNSDIAFFDLTNSRRNLKKFIKGIVKQFNQYIQVINDGKNKKKFDKIQNVRIDGEISLWHKDIYKYLEMDTTDKPNIGKKQPIKPSPQFNAVQLYLQL